MANLPIRIVSITDRNGTPIDDRDPSYLSYGVKFLSYNSIGISNGYILTWEKPELFPPLPTGTDTEPLQYNIEYLGLIGATLGPTDVLPNTMGLMLFGATAKIYVRSNIGEVLSITIIEDISTIDKVGEDSGLVIAHHVNSDGLEISYTKS